MFSLFKSAKPSISETTLEYHDNDPQGETFITNE